MLTIEDTRKLAAAPITVEQFDEMIDPFQKIGLPGSIFFGADYITAIHLTQLVIALSLIWFWLHQREAMLSGAFPSEGTLFAVFSRGAASRCLFHLLVIVPVIAAALLAVSIWKAKTTVGAGDKWIDVVLAFVSFAVAVKIAHDIKWFAVRPPSPEG
ncbi:MAG: hypothetical protein GEU99_02205 [Luteitalea sp.]|nr:hypothetical protein [Luteitalea sp.]